MSQPPKRIQAHVEALRPGSFELGNIELLGSHALGQLRLRHIRFVRSTKISDTLRQRLPVRAIHWTIESLLALAFLDQAHFFHDLVFTVSALIPFHVDPEFLSILEVKVKCSAIRSRPDRIWLH